MKLIVTCEHAGNDIPKKFQFHFENESVILNSHRGYDLGAFDIFQYLKPLSNYSKYSKTSRLLIELNRSLHHPKLFSAFSKQFSEKEKKDLIETLYEPYRTSIESEIKKYIDTNNSVIHISVHSFTPILNSIKRNCDIGLLFDSSKKEEKQFCKQLKSTLIKFDTNLNIRFNYPYLGKSDGFTTFLRKKYPENYLGIELEINQKFSNNNKIDNNLRAILFDTIEEMVTMEH